MREVIIDVLNYLLEQELNRSSSPNQHRKATDLMERLGAAIAEEEADVAQHSMPPTAIQAMDAKSFADFAARNSSALGDAVGAHLQNPAMAEIEYDARGKLTAAAAAQVLQNPLPAPDSPAEPEPEKT